MYNEEINTRINKNIAYLESIRDELAEIRSGNAKTETGEEKYFCDWLNENVLDYDYTMSSTKEYRSCRLWVALGGPNVWIDTNNETINLAWGTQKESIWLPSEIAYELDEIVRETVKD